MHTVHTVHPHYNVNNIIYIYKIPCEPHVTMVHTVTVTDGTCTMYKVLLSRRYGKR